MVFIFKLCKKDIQPPGKHQEQHEGEVRATQNFIKDIMTEMVDIIWRIFGKS